MWFVHINFEQISTIDEVMNKWHSLSKNTFDRMFEQIVFDKLENEWRVTDENTSERWSCWLSISKLMRSIRVNYSIIIIIVLRNDRVSRFSFVIEVVPCASSQLIYQWWLSAWRWSSIWVRTWSTYRWSNEWKKEITRKSIDQSINALDFSH